MIAFLEAHWPIYFNANTSYQICYLALIGVVALPLAMAFAIARAPSPNKASTPAFSLAC